MAGPEDDNPADGGDPGRLLLVRQAALAEAQRELAEAELRTHRLGLIRARVGIALHVALLVFVTLAILLSVFAAVAAARSDKLVVDSFDVPEGLAFNGATGNALAAAVADELRRLGQAAPAEGMPERLERKVVLAQDTAFPFSLLRRLLGQDRHMGGSVIRGEDGTLQMIVRGDEVEAQSFTGRSRDLPLLAIRAAEHAYGASQPAAYLSYLMNAGRPAEAADFASRAYGRARDDWARAAISGPWAEALAALGRPVEAEERASLALSLDPWNWHAQAALIQVAPDDEAAIAASRKLHRRAGQAPAARPPSESAFTTEYRLTQNWTKLVSLYGGAEGSGPAALLAEAEAHRHDHQAARRFLARTEVGDALAEPAAHLTAGLRELDLGRADRAVAPLERFHRAALARPELGRLLRGDRCYLALAYGRLGRSRDALRLLDFEPGSARCAALRGDVLALAGDWRGASGAYRKAMQLAPSSPIPFERAGAALLARDQAEAAVRLFQAAIARGPCWADPRFGLAEAMMQLGRFAQAEEQYRAAANFAPRWGELHLARGEALWRLGRQREARTLWQAAATMALSTAARIRLQQLITLGSGAAQPSS